MAAGETLKAIIEDVHVSLRADLGSDEHPARRDILAIAARRGTLELRKVGLAAVKQIRARLAEEKLRALGKHKGSCEAKSKPHPASLKNISTEGQ